MIELEHVSVTRNGRAILSDVSATFAAGRVTAVMGSNGAGKTTVVRLISGELEPSAGLVAWRGNRLRGEDRRALARRRAVVPQHSSLSFGFRVRDVVLLGRLPHAWATSRADEQVADACIHEMDLDALRDRDYTTLSGGERQRVHLARALAQLHEARGCGCGFLILDEPTAHLDLSHQQRILTLARKLAAEGLGVLVVLHDLNLAARYADTLLLLREGRLITSGAPLDILDAATIRSVFGITVTSLIAPDGHPAFLPSAENPDRSMEKQMEELTV